MKLADIQERATQNPFRPFALETNGGTWIDVEHQSCIYLPPVRPDIIIIFDQGGRMFILNPEQITALEVR